MKPASVSEPVPAILVREAPQRLSYRVAPAALWTLFWLTIRQHARARRMTILCVVLVLPAIFAAVVRWKRPEIGMGSLEYGLIFTLFPQALVPLAALWYSSGMIQDELEEQTLTYLLLRPLPRWGIYLAKLLATICVTAPLLSLAAFFTELVIRAGAAGFWEDGIIVQAAKMALLFALAVASYASIFGCLSLFFRRSLVVGVAYILILEGVIANIDFVARSLTVMFYFRVLVERWLGLHFSDWTINLQTAPGAGQCLVILAAACVVPTIIGAISFATKEFRVKTPEEN
jgi:ABC-2 type transport system permease protein